MLKELQVKNWLSYETEKVTFSDQSTTVAVVGDNGHGKSSLLEAIPFCLFGDGRDDTKKLIRLGSEGGMSTKVTLSDVPGPGREMVIERGVTDAGNGYTKVWIDGDLIEKAGAKSSNNKAQDFINTTLGLDKETFTLTSFFGLGTNDSLMQVTPSTRLETLQKLAGIDVCQKFHRKANEEAKNYQQSADKEKRAIELLSESVEDTSSLNTQIEKAKEELTAKNSEIERLYVERTKLRADEDRYQGLLREKEGLDQRRQMLMKQKDKYDKQKRSEEAAVASAKEDAQALLEERKEVEAALNGMKSVEQMQEKLEASIIAKTEAVAAIDLRRTALQTNTDVCPLCGGPLSDEARKKWSVEIEELSQERDKQKGSADDIKKLINRRENLEKKLEKLKRTMADTTKSGEQAEKVAKEAALESKKTASELVKVESRLKTIGEEMVGYDVIVDHIQKLDRELGEVQTAVGSLEGEIKSYRQRIEASKKAKKTIRGLEEKVSEYMELAQGYKVVAEAFSRYAIPVQLLRKIREEIEKRSTRVYQQFNYGQILIRDIEGARPGVEFVLLDEMGERSYKALSAGEKVMMFLSVRVAITQIINGARRNMIDFLILDEVAGNLSPQKRESLTKLINTLLIKYFPQVFMVSHVELRDIFDRTVHVTKEEGVSHVE